MTGIIARLTAALADRYQIERELGAGGMATVYLAHDVRHDRKVALKVLRPELAAILGGERFLKEIRTTANLQHPHILSLFDSGEADGTVFYVMPYVAGESLRDRLSREKQLPVEDAIRIAREVASALDYAHRHNVVHRDIKPENILLHDGTALVADFGIALAASRSEGGTRMTETGMSLGTPHYMAPEQAMGEREITPKADIYALGCVLYEMLTAEPPFTGATAQAIIARVMTEEPRSLTMQRRTIPPHVELVVRKALEKLPADRFATAADLAAALEQPGLAVPVTRAHPVARDGRSSATRMAPWALAGAFAGVAAWSLLRPAPAPAPGPVTRFALSFDSHGQVVDAGGSPLAVSPDGSRIAYLGTDPTGTRWIYIRAMDRTEPVLIAGSRNAVQPFFSPDGAVLGFFQDGKLRKTSLAGGAVVAICCDAATLAGASWGTDSTIVFGVNGVLYRVSAAGGQADTIARPDSGDALRWPELLPDGKTVLFTWVRGGQPTLGLVRLGDTSLVDLRQPGMSPRWVNGGFVTFLQSDGTMFSAPFDAERARFTAEPTPIAEGVRVGPAQVAKAGVSRSGTIVYLGGSSREREIALVDRRGLVATLPSTPLTYFRPRFSPDGRRIAVADLGGSPGRGDIWVLDIATGTPTRLTFDSVSGSPEWTPDGRRLIYARISDQTLPRSIFRVAADGSGLPESLATRPGPIFELALSGDGRTLLFRETAPQTTRDIWVARVDSLAAPRALLRTPFDERSIALSPDGEWLAYVSNATDADEVYVRRLAEGSGVWRISTGAGREPRWARGGRELLYRKGDTVFTVDFMPGAEPRFSTPRMLFTGRFTTDANNSVWDVAPDGQRFAFTRDVQSGEQGTLNVILNWFDERGRRRQAR